MDKHINGSITTEQISISEINVPTLQMQRVKCKAGTIGSLLCI